MEPVSRMECMKLPEQYLSYPKDEIMEGRVDSMPFEVCAQFLMYWARANLRGGWEFFYRIWQEGTAVRVLRRMDGYVFEEERPSETASIELELGDITAVKADFVVNPTDEKFSGSGGTARTHIRSCASGSVLRVLDHMEQLLNQ